MTLEESDQIEELIMLWYRWSAKYRPHLGCPKSSRYSLQAVIPDVYADSDDMDDRLNAMLAEQIEVCIDTLPWQMRSAIGIHAANKAAKVKVFSNQRLTKQQHHEIYQAAKAELLIAFQKKNLMRNPCARN